MGEPDDPVLEMLPPHTETIPVRSIIGSVDRWTQLDRRFRPKAGESGRLRGIRVAMLAGASFPPIEVYRLDGACYVIDGHHRVAAAKEIGQLYFDAVVTECRRRSEAGAEPGDALEAARIGFGLRTGLRSVHISRPEGYAQALDQVYEHRWYLCERGKPVSLKDAAEHWHRTVFQPVLSQVVAEGLATAEDAYASGDLYLRLSDLKYLVSAERGRDVGFAVAIREGLAYKRRLRRLPIGRRGARHFA